MLQHEPLHLAVVATAPVVAGQEGPTDLNDAALRVIAVVAGRSDDVAGGSIERDERATGREGLLEERSEWGLLIAISVWMLFPDERIRRDSEQRLEVVGTQGPQLEELSEEHGLSIE